MFFEINTNLCEKYSGLDPIKLLDYPAEDVFDLINGLVSYNERTRSKDNTANKNGVIRKKAGNNWF